MIVCNRVTVERLGVVVLERLDLRISAGQAVAVIGPTGAGKTSLLETIATLLPLRSGELTVAGCAATQQGETIRRLVGYVPDGVPAWPAIRIDECLELFAAAGGLRGRDLTNAVGRALARVGLERMAGERCDAVSSGQSKRLLLARALLLQPTIFLLDNPAASLDPAGRELVSQLISDTVATGGTVVAACNDVEIPPGFTDLLILHEGQLLRAGPCRPEAWTEVSSWRLRFACPAAAQEAARVIGHIAIGCECPDDDSLLCELAPSRGPVEETVTALVKAGIPVAGCRYDPPWPAQLLAAIMAAND
jgi:ABC-type multidrug transport system ATPase subunit